MLNVIKTPTINIIKKGVLEMHLKKRQKILWVIFVLVLITFNIFDLLLGKPLPFNSFYAYFPTIILFLAIPIYLMDINQTLKEMDLMEKYLKRLEEQIYIENVRN